MPHRAKFQTLGDRRAACAHPQLIEIRQEGAAYRTHAYRFCLACGEEDKVLLEIAPAAPPHFLRLDRGHVILALSFTEPKALAETYEVYHERLHVRGLFSEFDARGSWLGDTDPPNIIRGVD